MDGISAKTCHGIRSTAGSKAVSDHSREFCGGDFRWVASAVCRLAESYCCLVRFSLSKASRRYKNTPLPGRQTERMQAI